MNFREQYSDRIKASLESLSFVTWDRFVESTFDLDVYGWISRKDGSRDFVLLQFFVDEYGVFSTTSFTSSAKYSREISVILFGEEAEHSDCIRVENHFDITNKATLSV